MSFLVLAGRTRRFERSALCRFQLYDYFLVYA
jgi:hypothetical protein